MATTEPRPSTSPIDKARWALRSLVFAGGLVAPAAVQANMGTPLMWAGQLHMAFGNAVIGVLEGCIIARIFKVPSSRAVPTMILANYFSAWIGWLWLIPQTV